MLFSFKKKLLEEFKNNSCKPVYFLYGTENYFIDKVSAFFEKNLLSKEERYFDQSIFYGSETTPREIILQARRFPLLGKLSLIILKEAQKLAKIEELIPCFNKPNLTTILVICYKDKTLDKKKEIYKILQKGNWLFEFKKLYDTQIPSWIEETATHLGYQITAKTSHLLAEHIGNNLLSLENQLKKVTITLAKGEEITPSLLMDQIGINRQYNNFELQKALSKKDISKVYKIIFYFLKNNKEYPLVFILGMLYNFFTKILLYHARMPNNELTIAKEIGVSPYFIGEYKEAYQHYTLREVLAILSEITKADAHSKGIESPFIKEEEILKELFFKSFNC